MTFRNCVAVDSGASSGARDARRVTSVNAAARTLREIHRFTNGLHSQDGYVTWMWIALKAAISPRIKEGVRGRDSYR